MGTEFGSWSASQKAGETPAQAELRRRFGAEFDRRLTTGKHPAPQETGDKSMKMNPPVLQMPEPAINEAELARALSRMVLPDKLFGLLPNPGGVLVVNPVAAEQIASSVFGLIRDLRAEAGKWITGDLYESRTTAYPMREHSFEPDRDHPEEIVSVYRREENGWWSYDGRDHITDGSVDTSGFRHLVAEPEPVMPPPGRPACRVCGAHIATFSGVLADHQDVSGLAWCPGSGERVQS